MLIPQKERKLEIKNQRNQISRLFQWSSSMESLLEVATISLLRTGRSSISDRCSSNFKIYQKYFSYCYRLLRIFQQIPEIINLQKSQENPNNNKLQASKLFLNMKISIGNQITEQIAETNNQIHTETLIYSYPIKQARLVLKLINQNFQLRAISQMQVNQKIPIQLGEMELVQNQSESSVSEVKKETVQQNRIPVQLKEMQLAQNSEDSSVSEMKVQKSNPNLKKTSVLPPIVNPSNRYQNIKKEEPILLPPQSSHELMISSQTQLDKRQSSSSVFGKTSPTKFRQRIPQGYELASYLKAIEHLNTQSYSRKIKNTHDGGQDFQPLQTCGNIQDLKHFGLGVYLYFQFLKRITITLFIISVILIFPLMAQFKGDGLATYTKSSSFTMTLAKFSLGNLNKANEQTYMIVTFADALSFIVMFIFYLHWRSFHKSVIDQLERDNTILSPVSYVVSVEQFYGPTTNFKTIQQELKAYFDTIFRGVYQVQVVYNYRGNFDKFIDYDKKIQHLQKQRQISRQTNEQNPNLAKQMQQLQKLQEQLLHISQAFEPLYAIVHFKTLRSKLQFLNHCKRYRLINTFGQNLQRTLCCTNPPPQRLLFLNKYAPIIKSSKLSRPEQINWRNIDLSSLSIFLRSVCSLFLVILSIIITSALIGFCTLYVASTSSCQNVQIAYKTTYPLLEDQVAYLISISADESIKYCFCNDNLDAMYSNTVVKSYCADISNKVLITNLLQVAASVVSSITNVLLSIIITVISQKLLRPNTIPKQYVFIFWGVLISNYINSAILPLMLNADIFGTQFISYLKFIQFMNFDKISIFKDFTTDWYALISPYYVTMMIIATFVSPIISLILFALKSCLLKWKIKKMCEAQGSNEPAIQKEVNEKITDLKFDYSSQWAVILLYLFIGFMYSGLIPIMIPIITVGFTLTFFCKKAIIVKFSVKIPADQTLSQSAITFMPFVLLFHGLFSLWSHTTPGIFQSTTSLVSFKFTLFGSDFDRVFTDVIILAQPAIIILIYLLDLTIFNFIGIILDCCKDELEMPVQWAAIQNAQFSDRLNKANILGSYKLANNPQYGHAIKAYKQLLFRVKNNNDQNSEEIMRHQRFD